MMDDDDGMKEKGKIAVIKGQFKRRRKGKGERRKKEVAMPLFQ